MKRSLLASLLALAASAAAAPAADSGKPNVIVILSDDVGYGEYGFQGNKEIPTPNIDSIAKNGVRFTQGYVSGPYCSPTRAGLLTGGYQTRFGHEFNEGGPTGMNKGFGLPVEQIEALKSEPWRGLPLLEPLRADDSRYVQNSVANWLNDAAKTQPQWVQQVCERWSRDGGKAATQYIVRRAQRSIRGQGS